MLLFGGAFYGADQIAEDLVRKMTRNRAHDSLLGVIPRVHMKFFAEQNNDDDRQLNFARAMSQEGDNYHHGFELVNLETDYQILSLDNVITPRPPNAEAADGSRKYLEDEDEIEKIRELKQEFSEYLIAQQKQEMAANDPQSVTPESLNDIRSRQLSYPFKERHLPGQNQYHYYSPFPYNRTVCTSCHFSVPASTASTTDVTSQVDEAFAFPVIKVIVPYEQTQRAINRIRAVLIAGALMTVFLAMVTLYIIFKYVVVMPLNHLREVSDEISRGQTDRRAEINTNDEFEELAASFNRMLRHLTDTQRDLRLVNEDLDRKIDELAQANMSLYEMNRLKGDFLANMSHELRTPLNSIIGFSEVLQGIESLNDKQKRYAQNIQKSGRVLLEMINDILDLAKVEAGKMELKPTEFRLETIINAQCDMVRSLTEEKNIDLDTFVPEDLEPMYQDQSKIQQILTNLLSNAIKFTPEGGRITVSAILNSDGMLDLSVSDTGVGIAKEDQEVIFEKFRQGARGIGGDNLTREYSGTGLGLSIVKELCILMGGEISLTSEIGRGSTFKIILPWSLPSSPQFDTSSPLEVASGNASRIPSPPKAPA